MKIHVGNLRRIINEALEKQERDEFITQANQIDDMQAQEGPAGTIICFLQNTDTSIPTSVTDVDNLLMKIADENNFVLLTSHDDEGTFFDRTSRGHVWQFTPSDTSSLKEKYTAADLPPYVLHVTPVKSLWPILHQGLIPKVRSDNVTRSTLGTEGTRMKYKPRIYLCRDRGMAEMYADTLDVNDTNWDVATLRVKTSIFPKDMVVYRDEEYSPHPGYEQKLPMAMYITEPVPPEALKALDCSAPYNDGPIDATDVYKYTSKTPKGGYKPYDPNKRLASSFEFVVRCGYILGRDTADPNKRPVVFNNGRWVYITNEPKSSLEF